MFQDQPVGPVAGGDRSSGAGPNPARCFKELRSPARERLPSHLVDLDNLRCPQCRSVLVERPSLEGVACRRCRTAYPIVGVAPILVSDPTRYLCDSLAGISSTYEQIDTLIRELENLRCPGPFAFRRNLVDRAITGQRLNLALVLEQQHALLVGTTRWARTANRTRILQERVKNRLRRTTLRSLVGPPRDADQVGYRFDAALSYLRVDWAGTPEGEAQVAAVREIVSANVAKFCESRDRALYLGSGLGRHAFEGSGLFSRVTGVDLSYVAAALLAALRRHPVEFEAEPAGRPPPAQRPRGLIGQRFRRRSPRPVTSSSSWQTPPGSPSLTTRKTPSCRSFLSDVVPLSQLMPEVKRVLRPGGRFISFGPCSTTSSTPPSG